MKTKNAVLALAAVIMASTFTLAAGPTSKVVVLNPNNSEIFKVIYEGVTAGKVTLKVYDSNSNLLLAETTKGLSKFMRPLNFGGLDHGVYTVEVTDEAGTQTQILNYKKGASSIEIVHVAKLNAEGKYLLSVVSKGASQVSVRIFDGNSNLIHDESVAVNGSVSVIYTLKDVEGEPTFEVE
jgi:hypothetical protein